MNTAQSDVWGVSSISYFITTHDQTQLNRVFSVYFEVDFLTPEGSSISRFNYLDLLKLLTR